MDADTGRTDPTSRSQATPTARTKGLIVEEMDDETLVYDRDANAAHCLNRTAAEVWRSADGETTVPEIARHLRELGLPDDESVVRMALSRLDKLGLMDAVEDPSSEGRPVTRKEVLKTLGKAAGIAMLLPAVTSVTAPLAAQAASCITASQCWGSRPPNCTGLPICGNRTRCCQERSFGGGRWTLCRPYRC